MTTIPFGTPKFVKQLEAGGVPPKQAEAFVEAQQEILSQALNTTLATKADLDKMERRIDLKLIEHDGEFKLIKWMLGILIGGVLMIVLKIYFPVPL